MSSSSWYKLPKIKKYVLNRKLKKAKRRLWRYGKLVGGDINFSLI